MLILMIFLDCIGTDYYSISPANIPVGLSDQVFGGLWYSDSARVSILPE